MITIRRKQSAPGLYHGSPGSSTRVSASGLFAEAALDGKKVTLYWSAPNVPHNPSSSMYQIYKAGQFINTTPGTAFTYEDTAVMSGVEYVYQVFLIYNPT